MYCSSSPDELSSLSSCPNPADMYQVVFHPILSDARVQYPSHFKRFEVQMFAFAEDKDNLSRQVIMLIVLIYKAIMQIADAVNVFIAGFRPL